MDVVVALGLLMHLGVLPGTVEGDPAAHLSAQEYRPMPDLVLDTWWVHEGVLTVLAPLPGTAAAATADVVSESALDDLLRTTNKPAVFTKKQLPVTMGLSSDPMSDATWWLVTQFTADAEVSHRAVGIWADMSDCFYRIYVNGRLLGQQGSQNPFFMRSPLPPSFVIPPDTLHTDRVNTIAIEVRNVLFLTRLINLRLTSVENLQTFSMEHFVFTRSLNVGLTAVLFVMAVFCFIWTSRRPDEHDSLYLSFGVLGYAILFLCNTIYWPPTAGSATIIGGTFGAWLGTAFMVFFEMRYERPHARRFRQAFYVGFCAVVLGCLLFQTQRQFLHFLECILGINLVSFVYCAYVNWAAYRDGQVEARSVLMGYVAFACCVSVDVIELLVYQYPPQTMAGIGISAFVMGTVLTLTSRFLKLHESSAKFAASLQRRQELQEYVVEQIAGTASEIEQVATHILKSATQQQQGSTEQATAVEETRITMDSLLESGKTITTAAHDVLKNAEMTQRHNLSVVDRITESTRQSGRISEILEIIRDVANKSELLALNAALEGSRAGDAGRGFALVAQEMQRLAETVMAAVADIKTLTSDIRLASSATEAGTQEATRLANETTVSAKQIGLIIQGQQAGTEQVSRAMDDIAEVAVQTARLGRLPLEGTQTLSQMAERLRSLIAELHRERPA